MAGSIRSLDDLTRKGFDLNVLCQRCKRHRTFPIDLIRAVFRQHGWSEEWTGAARRFRCSSCGSKLVELRAFILPREGALDVLREAVRHSLNQRIDTPEVRKAIAELMLNRADHAALHALWWHAAEGDGYDPGRSQSIQSAMRGVLRMYFLDN